MQSAKLPGLVLKLPLLQMPPAERRLLAALVLAGSPHGGNSAVVVVAEAMQRRRAQWAEQRLHDAGVLRNDSIGLNDLTFMMLDRTRRGPKLMIRAQQKFSHALHSLPHAKLYPEYEHIREHLAPCRVARRHSHAPISLFTRRVSLHPTRDTMAAGMRLLAAALLMACLAVVAARQPAEQEHTLRDSKGISPCAIGPSYWCRSAKNQQQCGVKNQVVGCALHACAARDMLLGSLPLNHEPDLCLLLMRHQLCPISWQCGGLLDAFVARAEGVGVLQHKCQRAQVPRRPDR